MSWRLDSEWRERALCGREDPAKFFPEGRPGRASTSFCDDCPVRQECLDFALSSPWKPSGIWAGMSPKELVPLWMSLHPASPQSEVHQLLGLD